MRKESVDKEERKGKGERQGAGKKTDRCKDLEEGGIVG